MKETYMKVVMSINFNSIFKPSDMRSGCSFCYAKKSNFMAKHIFKIKVRCIKNFGSLIKKRKKSKFSSFCYMYQIYIHRGYYNIDQIRGPCICLLREVQFLLEILFVSQFFLAGPESTKDNPVERTEEVKKVLPDASLLKKSPD